VISGDIHDTVKNCHSIRLSSGLRSCDVGCSYVGLIWSFGRAGSRNGIERIISIVKKVEDNATSDSMFSICKLECTATSRARRVTKRPTTIGRIPRGAVRGRSMVANRAMTA